MKTFEYIFAFEDEIYDGFRGEGADEDEADLDFFRNLNAAWGGYLDDIPPEDFRSACYASACYEVDPLQDAAPDLLQALEAAQLQMERDAVCIDGESAWCRSLQRIIQDKDMPEAWELVVAAIAKVKGKSE